MECIKYVVAAHDMSPRIATELCSIFSSYNNGIYLSKDSRRCNAKSILGVMSLGIKCGDSVGIFAIGDSDQALLIINQAINLM